MTSRVKKIIDILKRAYPERRTHLKAKNPLNLLVATMLSAQCTDKMVNKLTPSLFKKYKGAKDYRDSDMNELRRDIRSIGLYKGKAKNIKGAAKRIADEFGGRVPDTMEKLLLLPGVGRKTANIVLSNAFGKSEGIAVDTHVSRISRKLGFSDHDAPPKIESDLMRIVPKKDWGIFNTLLVTHGRAVCRARNPLHEACSIKKYCDWYKRNFKKAGVR